MLKKQTFPRYQQVICGTWGRFNTQAGLIEFLETKARIGPLRTDPETRLTRFLKPVREALPTRQMDFNQLLQRDLDDHRVATQLVPYLLNLHATGPAFFPPVVTALLPVDGKKPLDTFPPGELIVPKEEEDAWWAGTAYGEAFKFEKVVNPDGQPYYLKIGRLSWNDERAQLVVLDGQHRAMALLAIHRTINKLWEGDAEKYKHFYEEVVQDLLRQFPPQQQESLFANIELPVTVLWFPQTGPTVSNYQLAARKLFVDVNKNARAPSESRILLLSDSELSAILLRRILNTCRSDEPGVLPMAAIEYDHPEKDQASSAKWSAITNVSILHGCVYRAVFGPKKYISNLASNFKGKESPTESAKFMHASLKISDVIPAVVEERERLIQREDITNTNFPRSALPQLEGQLMKGWGHLLVRMLNDLLPFKAHGQALIELRNGWSGAGSTGALAKGAIFEGFGMYWTLRDSHLYWRERNKILSQSYQPPLNKTDVVQAWEETEKKRGEFEKIRAKHYLGVSNDKAVEASRETFTVFATHACQLGFVLAARSLALLGNVPFENLVPFIDALIDGANAGLAGDAPGDYGRKTFLWKGAPSPLNLIPKLDTPFAVYFRYFWLELLGSREARPFVERVVQAAILDDAIQQSRRHYYQKLKEIYEVSLHGGHPEWDNDRVEREAEETARKELAKALKKWFDISPETFTAWLTAPATGTPTQPAGEEQQAGAAPEGGEPEGEERESPPSLEELLHQDRPD